MSLLAVCNSNLLCSNPHILIPRFTMRVLYLLSVWLVPVDSSSSQSACDTVSFYRPWIGSLRKTNPKTPYSMDMTPGVVENIKRVFGEAGCRYLAELSKRLPNDPPADFNAPYKFLEHFNLLAQVIFVAKAYNHGDKDHEGEVKDFEFRLLRTLGILDDFTRREFERPKRIEELQHRSETELSSEIKALTGTKADFIYDTVVAFRPPINEHAVDPKKLALDMIEDLRKLNGFIGESQSQSNGSNLVSELLRLVARLFLYPYATRNHSCIVKNAVTYLGVPLNGTSEGMFVGNSENLLVGLLRKANSQIPEQSWRKSLEEIHRIIGRCKPIGLW